MPLAWAAEAVALAWVWARRDHRYSGAWALVLGALAIGHLLAFEYPVVDVTRGFAGQRQMWFAFRFTGADAEVDLRAFPPVEFDSWRWARLDEALERVVPFKRATYQTVIERFRSFAEPV